MFGTGMKGLDRSNDPLNTRRKTDTLRFDDPQNRKESMDRFVEMWTLLKQQDVNSVWKKKAMDFIEAAAYFRARCFRIQQSSRSEIEGT